MPVHRLPSCNRATERVASKAGTRPRCLFPSPRRLARCSPFQRGQIALAPAATPEGTAHLSNLRILRKSWLGLDRPQKTRYFRAPIEAPRSYPSAHNSRMTRSLPLSASDLRKSPSSQAGIVQLPPRLRVQPMAALFGMVGSARLQV